MENQSGFSTSCSKCGRTIYEGEMLNVKGRYVCENCAYSSIFEKKDAPAKKRRVPSAFFHFCFSMLPGAGHMYLGLMKKGLFQMCLFFFCIYLTSEMPFFNAFAFVIAIVWIYSFFDSLSLRRRLVAGEDLSDDIHAESSFFNRNMGLIAIVVIVMLVIGGISSVVSSVIVSSNNEFSKAPAAPPVPFSENYSGNKRGEVYIEKGGSDEVITYSFSAGRRPKERSWFDTAKPIILIGVGGLIVYNVMKNRNPKPKKEDSTAWTYEDKTNE